MYLNIFFTFFRKKAKNEKKIKKKTCNKFKINNYIYFLIKYLHNFVFF